MIISSGFKKAGQGEAITHSKRKAVIVFSMTRKK
jgi:hypothetical protein